MSTGKRLSLIILAAGAGRRLGRDKPTLPWGRTTLLGHVIQQFPSRRVEKCVVVTNPRNRDDVRRIVGDGAEVVVNSDPHSEMIASVRLGIQQVASLVGPFCIHPVDVFAVSPRLVALLHEAWITEPERIHVPRVSGKGGHPLVLPSRFASGILALEPGLGLNHLLREHAAAVVHHAWADELLLADLDTPADYARYRPGPG